MSARRGPARGRSYGWAEAREDLEDGVHPEVAALRLGVSSHYLLEVAAQQGWAVSHKQLPSPDEILDNFAKLNGLDS